jgi:hypothetical protein
MAVTESASNASIGRQKSFGKRLRGSILRTLHLNQPARRPVARTASGFRAIAIAFPEKPSYAVAKRAPELVHN